MGDQVDVLIWCWDLLDFVGTEGHIKKYYWRHEACTCSFYITQPHQQVTLNQSSLLEDIEGFSRHAQVYGDPTHIMKPNQFDSALEVFRSASPSWKVGPLNIALHLYRLSALGALRPLFDRNITEPCDLIALGGNLCIYGIRLNAGMVRT